MPTRRVLIIGSYPGSVVSFRGALIAALQEAGQEVHVAAPGLLASGAIAEYLVDRRVLVHDVPVRRAGTSTLDDMVLAIKLFALIRRVGPDAILCYTIKPVIYGTLVAWALRVRARYALVTGLGYAFTGGRRNLLTRLIRLLYRLALSCADKVFFQNPDDEALFRQMGILGEDADSVVVNGSGVDLLAFKAEPAPGGPLTFLMIGRLLGDKGAREYAAAAARVRVLRPDVRFALVGWIDENPDAIDESELAEWVRSSTLEFHGKLSDVRAVIAACSVYVLPSYREGTPRTVLEAMAIGRPIITTDAPGCRETVIDGDNGFLVPVKSVDALVEAMLRFVHDPELAQRMGRRSREIAEEKYDVHKVNAVMLREMGITAATEALAGIP